MSGGRRERCGRRMRMYYLQLTAVDVDRKSVVGCKEQMSWIDFRWLVG